MGSRSVMLDRIRRACAGADAGELPSQLPDFPHYSDPVAQFRQEFEAVGGVFLEMVIFSFGVEFKSGERVFCPRFPRSTNVIRAPD